ncbi:hypothetical protein HNY73_016506 [Argiope bruennichi]|uniref:Uncharacterized protein n=1 Tax=Argiope bruennichi TaxID=94029 RepID=A0A8T0EMZ5_ARGBR|nr:hypothetical protein HNY73_016506 [Argiope bruennichi]
MVPTISRLPSKLSLHPNPSHRSRVYRENVPGQSRGLSSLLSWALNGASLFSKGRTDPRLIGSANLGPKSVIQSYGVGVPVKIQSMHECYLPRESSPRLQSPLLRET